MFPPGGWICCSLHVQILLNIAYIGYLVIDLYSTCTDSAEHLTRAAIGSIVLDVDDLDDVEYLYELYDQCDLHHLPEVCEFRNLNDA